MRELKFRAWNGSHMLDWPWLSAMGQITSKFFDHDLPDRSYEVMQFTGLKDKNGKEIYEGDVVNVQCRWNGAPLTVKAVIEYQPGAFWFRGISHAITDCNWHFYESQYMEIIGNIWENGDLLK